MANLGNASSPVTTEEADTTIEAEVDDIDETQLDTVETEVDVSTAGTEVDVTPAEPVAVETQMDTRCYGSRLGKDLATITSIKEEPCTPTEETEETKAFRLRWLRFQIEDRRREEAEVRMVMTVNDQNLLARVTWMRHVLGEIKELEARLEGRAGLVRRGSDGYHGYHWHPMYDDERQIVAGLKAQRQMNERRWRLLGFTKEEREGEMRAWWAIQEPSWRKRSEEQYKFLSAWFRESGEIEAADLFRQWESRRQALLTEARQTLTVSPTQALRNRSAEDLEKWRQYTEDVRRQQRERNRLVEMEENARGKEKKVAAGGSFGVAKCCSI